MNILVTNIIFITQDGFARRNGVPVIDKDQHVEVLAFIEGEKYSSVTVKRKRNTTDHYDTALTVSLRYWVNQGPNHALRTD